MSAPWPINHMECGHAEYTRGCAPCIFEFRKLVTAIPPYMGDPTTMGDAELQDVYEFVDPPVEPLPNA